MKAGLVPEVFLEGIKELEEQFKYVEYTPPSIIRKAWDAFWSIRNTKIPETPVCHQSIYYYSKVMRIELSPYEVKLILSWDDSWYKYYKQYSSK